MSDQKTEYCASGLTRQTSAPCGAGMRGHRLGRSAPGVDAIRHEPILAEVSLRERAAGSGLQLLLESKRL
jgi:hypothetical protein